MNQKRYSRVQDGVFTERILPQPLLRIPPTTILALCLDVVVPLAQRLMIARVPKKRIGTFVRDDVIDYGCQCYGCVQFALSAERMVYQVRPPVLVPTIPIPTLCSSTTFRVFLFVNVFRAVQLRSQMLAPGVSTRFLWFNRHTITSFYTLKGHPAFGCPLFVIS